jgi:NADH dehydrogenase
VVWAAGVIASPAGNWLGAVVDRAGRVKVGPDLTVPGHPEIFVIGDTAAVTAPIRDVLGRKSRQPEPIPGLASPAMQQGAYAASVIRRRLRGRGGSRTAPTPAPFVYKDKGNLAIVGRSFAVADLKLLRFWGWPAWWLWLFAHIFYLIGFANRVLVMLQWAISFVSNRRGVRIFPVSGAEPAVPIDASTPHKDGAPGA